MAFSRVGGVRSLLRFSSHPAACGSSSSLLQRGEFGAQITNRLSSTELQPSERRDGGVLLWMTRHIASYVGTKLPSTMGTVEQDVHSQTKLTAAVTKWCLPVSSARSVGGYNRYPFAASGTVNTAGSPGLGFQQVRTIMVEVKRNDLDRAIRRWRRKCKEENLRVLKDREYYIKPSEKRVLANKERDRRIAKKAFKQKLNWIMSRRQRGF